MLKVVNTDVLMHFGIASVRMEAKSEEAIGLFWVAYQNVFSFLFLRFDRKSWKTLDTKSQATMTNIGVTLVGRCVALSARQCPGAYDGPNVTRKKKPSFRLLDPSSKTATILMAPKEPTRQQLSSRLAYQSKTPAFLLKLQRQVAGRGAASDEDEPQYVQDEEGEEELDEFGRERRRPPIPERPKDDPHHSDEEDDEDEKPVIVVVKEGKHLSEREVENEKRRGEIQR